MSDQSRGTEKRSPDVKEERGGLAAASSYAGLGLQFALSILLFLYAGQWLDKKLGTSPWLLMLGVFLGAGAGFYSIYRKLMADQRREESLRK